MPRSRCSQFLVRFLPAFASARGGRSRALKSLERTQRTGDALAGRKNQDRRTVKS
jgi:hypothetical protein